MVFIKKEEAKEEGPELNAANITKYKTAADITNRALEQVITKCVPGAKIFDICVFGDAFIEQECSKIYNKAKGKDVIMKGVAFPTSLSQNNVICHQSPIASDPEIVLCDGDLVKIQLGAHIDGFSAQVAHTLVLGATAESPVTGRKADCIQAAYHCVEAALRTIVPGNKNWQVTDVIQKVVKDFQCSGVEGMLSHQIAKNVMDGEKTFVLNPSEQHRKEVGTYTFEEGEAYAIDILISSGEGKARTLETRTTVFKRNLDVNYPLKMKASRSTLAEINSNFGAMAFSLRQVKDEKTARMGMQECVNHNLVIPFTVLHEKEDQFVAHFLYTILLTSTGTQKITSFPWNQDLIRSDMTLANEEIKELLATDVLAKRSTKKKATKSATETTAV